MGYVKVWGYGAAPIVALWVVSAMLFGDQLIRF